MKTIPMMAILMTMILLAGCSQQPAPVTPATPAAPEPAAAAVLPAPAAPPPVVLQNDVGAVQVATPAEAASVKLALDSEGLRLFNSVSGASRLIAFGTAKDEVSNAMAMALKAQPQEQGKADDCGADYARWKGGLTTWFASGKFTGWSAASGSTGLATAAGIRTGSSRAELEAAYAAKVSQTSIGTEFSAGALAGVLDSARPDAKITNLWAGAACIMR